MRKINLSPFFSDVSAIRAGLAEDGAVIASNTGDLLLNTGTFGHSDLYDKDRYKSVDITSGMAYNSKENQDNGKTTNDQAQVPNKFIAGSYNIRNAEQVNRATVGAGEIVVRDNPGQELSGLNRDTDKAQELLKDEHKGEDLYLSSNSVEKVGQAAEVVGNAVPAVVEGFQRASARKDLVTGTPDERSAAAVKLLQYQVGSDADTPAGKELGERLADLARRDPAAASEALNAIQQLQNTLAPPGSQNFGPALEIGAVALIGLAAGTVVVSTNPEYQQKVADALASLPEAQRRNIENLTDLLGTEGFPIHKGDFGKFIFPAADKDTSTPATSGYGADGKVELPTHTGGDQIPQVESGNTGFPANSANLNRP